jgi:hypothetical protein
MERRSTKIGVENDTGLVSSEKYGAVTEGTLNLNRSVTIK